MTSMQKQSDQFISDFEKYPHLSAQYGFYTTVF